LRTTRLVVLLAPRRAALPRLNVRADGHLKRVHLRALLRGNSARRSAFSAW
jgi:hypothetical protein